MSHDTQLSSSDYSRTRCTDITTRLMTLTVALNLALMPAVAFAIDPIGGGAWSAAQAALGGGSAASESAAAAARAAGAATAASAAAAVTAAGVGVAAFCFASYAEGSNMCCNPATAIGAAIASASISCGGDGSMSKRVPPNDMGCEQAFIMQHNNTAPSVFGYYVVEYERISNRVECHAKYISTGSYRKSYYYYLDPPTTRPPTEEELGGAVAGSSAAAAATAAAAGAKKAGATTSAAEAAATAAAANAAPNTPANCASKGHRYGEFNGAIVCVALDGSGAPKGDTGTDTNQGTDTPGSTAGTDTGTGTGTGTGTAAPATPAFCTYAQTLCNFLDWYKTEPTTPTNTTVDIKSRDISDTPLSNVDISQSRVSFSSSCPSSQPINIRMFGSSFNYDFSYRPMCDFMTQLKPFVIAAAYISGAYIVSGSSRGGNDG